MSFTPGPGTTYLLTSTQPIPSGTANGVLYLNGSKVVTSGSALQFSGTALTVNLDGTSLVVGTGGASTTAASFRSTTRNQLRFPSGASFEWHEGVNELMRLNSTGLGIGTASPSAPLQFGKAVYGAPSDENFYRIKFSDAGGTANDAGIGQPAVGAMGFNVSDSTGYYQWNRGSAGELMRLDLSGNLGLGVTPSAWSGLAPALQVQRASIITSSASAVDTYFSSNAFYDGNWKYILSASATQYMQNVSGDHRWRVAASGTAGSTISFTQAMTLDTSGNLGIGTTSPGRKLHIVSNGPLRMGQASDYFDFVQSSTNLWSWNSNLGSICLQMNGATGAVVIGALVNTTATDGFLYVPTCAGTPTGTPNTYTGRAPIVIDTTNNKLYFYSGGQWRDAGP